jgi:hypothetical protein
MRNNILIKYKNDHTSSFTKRENVYSYDVHDKLTRRVIFNSEEYPSNLFKAILDAANKIREFDKFNTNKRITTDTTDTTG